MKCRHLTGSHPVHRQVGIHSMWILPCLKCGAWLPLAPARDTEQTAIEVRATELAEAVFDVRRTNRTALLSELGFNGAETAGWIECMYDSDKLPEQPGEHAGYLARVIAEHDDGGAP